MKNKNCRVITSALITVFAFITMLATIIMYPAIWDLEHTINWHFGGFLLALMLLAFVLWLFKTCTFTVSMVKHKEENYVPKLVFEVLTGFGFVCAIVAFCMPFAGVEAIHIIHAAMNLGYVGLPLAFISSLVGNALTIKK